MPIPFTLTSQQNKIVQAPARGAIFLQGPAGCGKTTTGVERMAHLLENGVGGEEILVIAAQRSLAEPYLERISDPQLKASIRPTILTVGGLAQRMVDHYWPLAAAQAGFAHPELPPVFLTQETSRYYMVRVVEPLFERGYFAGVNSNRGRIYSQILDTLNKTAVMGFPIDEIGARLELAWMGDERLALVGEQVQDCAQKFRAHCLANNLLDYSLQMDIFLRHLWPMPVVRDRLTREFRHIIVENIEEDTPAAHDLIAEWLQAAQSALLICDTDGGLRTFLGADAKSALRLRNLCARQYQFDDSFVSSPAVQSLTAELSSLITRGPRAPLKHDLLPALATPPSDIVYFPEMLDWAAETARRLVIEEGVPASQIAILAPFMPNSLMFSLKSRLDAAGIPSWGYRPSRTLKEEPAAKCLQTLARLSHPHWQRPPSQDEVAQALIEAIDGLDPVRGYLLGHAVYHPNQNAGLLLPLEKLQDGEVLRRVPFVVLERYERLRAWLMAAAAQAETELDLFVNRMFGEVLSQPGFRFHTNTHAGAVTYRLIRSMSVFREALEQMMTHPSKSIGQEYIEMAEQDVVATQHSSGSGPVVEDAVLLSPASSFVMSNTPVEHQIWLNVGDISWWRRFVQPLTHQYVLSRAWPLDRHWTENDDAEASQAQMHRLVIGLLRRCRTRVHIGICDMDEFGTESEGPLLRVLSEAYRRAHQRRAVETHRS